MPTGKAYVRKELYDAVELTVLGGAANDIATIITEGPITSDRGAQTLAGQSLQVTIQFRDERTGLSAEDTLRRKCELDAYVRSLEAQLADANSALRKKYPYLTGAQTTRGSVSSACHIEDDDLSGGAIAGIVLGSLVFVGIIAAVVVVATKKPAAPSATEPVAA